ncbi:unnamed protein product [Lupinus luteus]|uniref:chorismate mutase n=1 Tax=Lupinus luteus TaxID=3873 RepID=A0AAV1X0Y5_LUPLU
MRVTILENGREIDVGKSHDKEKLMDMLTYPEVEEAIKRRVEMKAKTYGQEVIINMKEHRTESVYK